MANRNLIITLGKVIVAAAWADGTVHPQEVNSLKDLLFMLPSLTALQWAELDMYIETPVDDAERTRLLAELRREIRSNADKELAVTALDTMINADGQVTDDERTIASEIKAAIQSADTSLFGKMNKLFSGPITRRHAITGTRDEYFREFVRNKVYYGLRRRLDAGAAQLNIPDGKLWKLSLAGGLLARVARASAGIADTEFEAIVRALETGWAIEHAEAMIVAEVAAADESATLDVFRLAREFVETYELEERSGFLDALFAVAVADTFVSQDELEAIRDIAQKLKLPNEMFIAAKLKIPREQRAG